MEKNELLYTEDELIEAEKLLHEIEMSCIKRNNINRDDMKQNNLEQIKALRIGFYAISELVWETFYKDDFIAKYGANHL